MLCQCIKSGNELFYHTNMFCRGTGSSTCSSRWQGFERIQPPSFWRRWSAAGLRGTPPHTRLSGNIEWQILLSLYLLYVAPIKKFFHQDTGGNKFIQWLYFRIGPVYNYFEYSMGLHHFLIQLYCLHLSLWSLYHALMYRIYWQNFFEAPR